MLIVYSWVENFDQVSRKLGKNCGFFVSGLFWAQSQIRSNSLYLGENTVVCISLETRSIASQPSVAVGWVKIKVWSMPHLKGLTANFKLM